MSPTRILGFVALHLYCQLVLCPAHIVYCLLTGLVNPYSLTRHLCEVLGIRFLKAKQSMTLVQSTSQRRVIYLSNHRSWADFFVDQAICGGASYLARYMVWIGTPVSSLYAWMADSTWFFNRKRGIDRVAFSQFMETSWTKRADFGMIAYPEGTRNQTQEPLTLKTGVLQFAYEYKHAVQVVITTNKEHVYNEKVMGYWYGTPVVTCCSELLDPKDFDSMESFVVKCRQVFQETWTKAYTDTELAEPYEPPMGSTHPLFSVPSQPFKTQMIRLVVLLACAALWLRG